MLFHVPDIFYSNGAGHDMLFYSDTCYERFLSQKGMILRKLDTRCGTNTCKKGLYACSVL